MNKIKIAQKSINSFSLNQEEYFEFNKIENCNILGQGSVYVKDSNFDAKIKINFGQTKGCKVFLGRNIQGNISIFFKGNNSLLYIGNDCRLKDLYIKSFQTEDFIAVGNGVTTTSKNTWISGHGAGNAKPAIIIGDDCMFSYDIVIRNSDAHPIFNLETEEQINQPNDIVHIEPHVWISERVGILKSVNIGACSILSLGCIVTKNIPRFSVATGIPAVAKIRKDIFWARNDSKNAKERAKYFIDRYKNS